MGAATLQHVAFPLAGVVAGVVGGALGATHVLAGNLPRVEEVAAVAAEEGVGVGTILVFPNLVETSFQQTASTNGDELPNPKTGWLLPTPMRY